MRLTRAGEYAVRCVMHLATQEKGSLTCRRDCAQAMNIPEQFLGKIAQQLTLAGILEVVQGSRGGYRLAADSQQLTLLDTVEAVIGEISLNDCVARPHSCPRSPNCPTHQVWESATRELRASLKLASFADLASPRRTQPI